MEQSNFENQLSELIRKIDSLNDVSIKIVENMKAINTRTERNEDAIAKVVDELSPVARKESCPYAYYINNVITLSEKVDKLETSVNYYKGAIWVFTGLLATALGILITVAVKVL